MKIYRNDPSPAVVKVSIRGNRVIVPVTLRHQGKEVRANLLLDTGASVTTIHTDLAGALAITPAELRHGTARVADGRSVPSALATISSLSTGSKSKSQMRISILSNDKVPNQRRMNFSAWTSSGITGTTSIFRTSSWSGIDCGHVY